MSSPLTFQDRCTVTEDAKIFAYLKRVTVELRRSRDRVRELENAADEPIAII
ncbi:polyketide synthase docking domain-containing protein, partial [Streptomyces sp. NPDC001404]|uniref:polyketide synthase docking domain-containing protein n=1 Tax=Streptomyces sp. NPDC001404 TaxID=3364571 RepID=UPI0036C8DAE8